MWTLNVPSHLRLPDNGVWVNRFSVPSSSSSKSHIVSQHRDKRHWACSCTGYCTHRKCKHLRANGLPAYETAFEAQFASAPASGATTATPSTAIIVTGTTSTAGPRTRSARPSQPTPPRRAISFEDV